MAISLVGPNLNLFGDAGNYETDPSTWGYTLIGSLKVKSLLQFTKGIASCAVRQGSNSALSLTPPQFIAVPYAIGNANFDSTKKYTVRAKVRVNEDNAPATDNAIISFKDVANPGFYSFLTETTVGDASGAWIFIEGRFDGSNFAPGITNHRIFLYMNSTGDDACQLIDNEDHADSIYIDEFEIYEYIELAPGCTLVIDVPGTVVTNASGPLASDGSITLARTGGTAPFQYSKDDGATWQVSNFFAGLAHGIYPMKVMDADGCTSAQSFSVNNAAAAFDFSLDKTDETIAGLDNGSITVTISGVGGPFTFSKDGGATYQAGNVFAGLAPGIYTIAVKDASGNIIAHNIEILAGTIIFDKIWLSRNPITYPTAADPGFDALTNVRIFNDVQVDENTDGTFISKLKVDLPPDTDGNVVFYNREAFTDSLKAIPPALNANTIIRLTDRIKFFKNNTAQLQDDQVDPPGGTTASLPHLVLLGGLSKFAWASMDFFGSYLPTNKKFLTWAPLVKPVDKAQEDYLNYFVFTLTTATLKLQIKAYFDDGTNQTAIVVTLAGVIYGQLYQIPAGPANTGAALINPAKNLVKYDLSLLDQGDVLISEVRTYVIDTISHPRKRLFMFLNSLGSYEVLRFTGVNTKSIIIAKTEVAKFLPYNYSALDGEFEMNDVSLRESNNMSTGYIKQADALAWIDYMQDFLIGRKVFDVTDGKRRPIQIQPATFPIAQDQNYEYFVRFTAGDAYLDENYTPKNI